MKIIRNTSRPDILALLTLVSVNAKSSIFLRVLSLTTHVKTPTFLAAAFSQMVLFDLWATRNIFTKYLSHLSQKFPP